VTHISSNVLIAGGPDRPISSTTWRWPPHTSPSSGDS